MFIQIGTRVLSYQIGRSSPLWTFGQSMDLLSSNSRHLITTLYLIQTLDLTRRRSSSFDNPLRAESQNGEPRQGANLLWSLPSNLPGKQPSSYQLRFLDSTYTLAGFMGIGLLPNAPYLRPRQPQTHNPRPRPRLSSPHRPSRLRPDSRRNHRSVPHSPQSRTYDRARIRRDKS